MTLKDFYNILIKSKLPVAYHHFEEGRSPAPPFVVYLVRAQKMLGLIIGAIIRLLIFKWNSIP